MENLPGVHPVDGGHGSEATLDEGQRALVQPADLVVTSAWQLESSGGTGGQLLTVSLSLS